jgi:hypothetical protein
MRSLGIVLDEVLLEHALQLLEGLEPGATAALDAEMLVECPASAPMRQKWRVEEGSDCLIGQAGVVAMGVGLAG